MVDPSMLARLVFVWTMCAGGVTVHAECLASPKLAATGVAAFPAKLGPALSGPFQQLAWGMPADQVAAALPAELRAAAGPERTWVKLGDAEVTLRANKVLYAIDLRYRDRKTALAALAVWGSPSSPDPHHHFEFWAGATGATRALLRPALDTKDSVIVELTAFSPLAEQLGGGAFSAGKQPLLGLPHRRVCLLSFDDDELPTSFHLPATEHSSGYLPVKVEWKGDRVASYKLEIDYTYDHDVKAAVPALLEKKLGKPAKWTRSTFPQVSCLQFGKDVYACDEETTSTQPATAWMIYVGASP
jgi:hypothetical protein